MVSHISWRRSFGVVSVALPDQPVRGSENQSSPRVAAVTLTGGWQQLTVSRTIAASGRSGLELYVTQATPAGGDALVVDDERLVKTN